jgi:hypothetical protein
VLIVAVAAPTELIGREVRAHRLESLLDLKDDLRYLMVKLLADEETAQRAQERASAST